MLTSPSFHAFARPSSLPSVCATYSILAARVVVVNASIIGLLAPRSHPLTIAYAFVFEPFFLLLSLDDDEWRYHETKRPNEVHVKWWNIHNLTATLKGFHLFICLACKMEHSTFNCGFMTQL